MSEAYGVDVAYGLARNPPVNAQKTQALVAAFFDTIGQVPPSDELTKPSIGVRTSSNSGHDIYQPAQWRLVP